MRSETVFLRHLPPRFLGIAAALGLLSSCHSVLPYKLGGVPADIRPGAGTTRVLMKMGNPEWREKTDDGNGEVWHYADYWHTDDAWANKWASWDLFFTRDENESLRLVGWKLVDPLTQESDARQAFYKFGSP